MSKEGAARSSNPSSRGLKPPMGAGGLKPTGGPPMEEGNPPILPSRCQDEPGSGNYFPGNKKPKQPFRFSFGNRFFGLGAEDLRLYRGAFPGGQPFPRLGPVQRAGHPGGAGGSKTGVPGCQKTLYPPADQKKRRSRPEPQRRLRRSGRGLSLLFPYPPGIRRGGGRLCRRHRGDPPLPGPAQNPAGSSPGVYPR